MRDVSEMRALTLRPWWAHAVAHLGKRVENRSRPIPPTLVGQRIAIHAGAGFAGRWLDEMDAASPWSRAERRSLFGHMLPMVECSPCAPSHPCWVAQRGIVATAVLQSCEPAWDAATLPSDAMVPGWADFGAAWWWHLDDVHTLATPIPVARGQLGLWRLDEETARKVRSAEVCDGG